jgi:peptidoglycan/LPS O-acetylase OafA/YrhL
MPRVRKLDSVRGVAALAVVLGHCGGLSQFIGPQFWFLDALCDAEAAVAIFFLLSGFVLALQLQGTQRPTLAAFYVRRFFRIWPLFAVVVLLAFLASHATGIPVTSLDRQEFPTFLELIQNLLMIGSAFAVDPPVWSLYIEMRLSLIFPALFLFTKRVSFWKATISSLAASILVSRAAHWNLPDFAVAMAEASRFLVLFAIGAALARPNPVERIYRRLPLSLKVLAGLLALACLEYYLQPVWPQLNRGLVNWAGATLLFVFCLYSTAAEDALNHPALLFLGRISYALYLVHVPILAAAEAYFDGPWSILFTLISSTAVAAAMHRYIEVPFIELGRKLSGPAMTAQPARVQQAVR